MFKVIGRQVMGVFFMLSVLNPAWAGDAAQAQQIVERADHYRLPLAAAKVVSNVQQFESGKLKKVHLYDVYIKPGRQSFILFRNGSENTQRLLMLQEKYWMLLPNTRRPIRITPIQKLLGEAAVGDVSTLTWSEDYNATILDANYQLDGVAAIQLELIAHTEGATYSKVILVVDRQSHFPLKAELYLMSGKLAKIAYFQAADNLSPGSGLAVKAMRLVDAIQKNRETRITYQSIESVALPDKYYNPAYLSRFSVKELL